MSELRRRIVVSWRDASGREQRQLYTVNSNRGRYYVRWNKYLVTVDPDADEYRIQDRLGPVARKMLMPDLALESIVKRCARFVLICGDSRGVTERVLADRVDAFRDLESDDRFRTMVLICKEPGIASASEPDGTSRGSFRFWPKCYAPLNAFIYTDPNAP